MVSVTLKRYNSFKKKNKQNSHDSFAPGPLIFKLQQDVWKFKDLCVS